MEHLLAFFLVGAVITLAELQDASDFNLVHVGARGIEDQISFLERTITATPIYDFKLVDAAKLNGVKLPENTEKRLHMMQKCLRRIKDHIKKSLSKHNSIMRRFMDLNLPYDNRQVPESPEEVKKDYLSYLMEGKFFYLQAMPKYIKKLSVDLNLTISEKEMKEAEAMLKPLQLQGTEEILNMTKMLGLEGEMPFS